jgi:hypothetical protein
MSAITFENKYREWTAASESEISGPGLASELIFNDNERMISKTEIRILRKSARAFLMGCDIVGTASGARKGVMGVLCLLHADASYEGFPVLARDDALRDVVVDQRLLSAQVLRAAVG